MTDDELKTIIKSVLDLPLLDCKFASMGTNALCRYAVMQGDMKYCCYDVNRVIEICMLDRCMKSIKGRKRVWA